MIVETFDQYSTDWFDAHSERPGASNFDKIITSKGNPTSGKTREQYLNKLAGQRVWGIYEETYQNDAMRRGIELEPEAREAYELITGRTVLQVGLCYRDEDKRYLCSPDGLLGNNGGFEIKCPNLATHTGYLRKNKLPTQYFQQVQGSLFITGRSFWDFMSYYPGATSFIVTVEPDLEFHKKLDKALENFCDELDQATKFLREKTS